MISTLRVHKPGLHTTIQDLGRYGLQSMGVPVSGALDSSALRIANLLVGNEPTTAALEVLAAGPTLEVNTESVRIAVAGGNALIERLSPYPRRLPTFESFCLHRGDVFCIGPVTDMAMTYLAVEGGFDLPTAMGSHSTYTRGGFGGFKGRQLASDDELSLILPAATDRDELRFVERTLPGEPPIRVIPGPQADFFTAAALDTLFSREYTVSAAVDRMGMRLNGPQLEHARGFNITSDGTAPGSIQVPGDGLPIVLLADRQTTGGYPKIGCVISADLPTLARLRPGSTIRFSKSTLEQATEARRERENWFARFLDQIKRAGTSGIIDPTALQTQNLVSGVVGPDDPADSDR
ncbi:MAG: allophanate hydrolase [Proteobacteria bacterium]|jgi:allophanate hydrolase|nr:allophanate hydrolase [Pseudomonadota bacterium]MDP6134956.1 biotin-dependent carboxyltransferase family protein [Arenicellales bacterium]HCF75167.1 allophanate hydrolase [Gammaproteobacteria bacterium]HJP08947.1 biotin-dependent carboxyltransferase family protein [Arenicellales bacterium]|tara:strand:- start:7520 stop:8569 length:1050 start_codon:yes stop_codon:yes gene_type:complete